jgi:hypothetical protein
MTTLKILYFFVYTALVVFVLLAAILQIDIHRYVWDSLILSTVIFLILVLKNK